MPDLAAAPLTAVDDIAPSSRIVRADRANGPDCDTLIRLSIGPELVDNPVVARSGLGDLEGLTVSIRDKGVLQPLIVARAAAFRSEHPGVTLAHGARFVLLAGHRRRAAARRAGLDAVPAVIRDDITSRVDNAVVALVENIQRAKLAPLEEARMLAVLRDLDLTQREMCERVGISQGQVSKRLRLLELPTSLQDAIDDGSLAVVDALAILHELPDLADQERCLQASRAQERSVRTVLRRIRDDRSRPPAVSGPAGCPVLADSRRGAAAPLAHGAAGSRSSAYAPPVAVPDARLLVGPEIGRLHTEAANARAAACCAFVRSGRAAGAALELLVDATLNPPVLRSATVVREARRVAEGWTRGAPRPDRRAADRPGGDPATRSLGPHEAAGRTDELAVAIVLAHREIDLRTAAPPRSPWQRASRRHVRRLMGWGVYRPTPYELAKLSEPEDSGRCAGAAPDLAPGGFHDQ